MKRQAGEDDTTEWLVPVWLVCKLPTDGAQMKLPGFYSLKETLDSIRLQRQHTQSNPDSRAKILNSMAFPV